MFLDVQTLQVVAIVICFVLGPVSLAFAPRQSHMQPSRYWGAALLALAGAMEFFSFRSEVASPYWRVAGLGLAALSLTFAQASARTATGGSGRDLPGWALLGAYVLTVAALEKLSARTWLSAPIIMPALGLLAFRVAFEFNKGERLPEGGALRAIGVLFALLGFSLVIHGIMILSDEGSASASVAHTSTALLMVALIAGMLLGTIVLLWVMSERIHSKMEQLVSLDSLTGALNRQEFSAQFDREASRSRRRPDAPIAILLIDIDQFRRVNDAYGQAAGNRLLKNTVEILRGMTRDYDLIGRLDSNTFGLLMPGTRSDNALILAERARREIEVQASLRSGLKNRMTVSVGIAAFGEHGDSQDALVRSAETALQQAKSQGGNAVIVADKVAPAPVVSAGSVQKQNTKE